MTESEPNAPVEPSTTAAVDWRQAGLDPLRWVVLGLSAVALFLLARNMIGQWAEKTTVDRMQRLGAAYFDGSFALCAAAVALLPYAAVLICRGRQRLVRCAWVIFALHECFLLGRGDPAAVVVLGIALLAQRRRTWVVFNVCLTAVTLFLAVAVPALGDGGLRGVTARMRSDLYSMEDALEAYRTDHGVFPPSAMAPRERLAWDSPVEMPTFCVGASLTTPVAYFFRDRLPLDEFRLLKEGKRSFAYWSDAEGRGFIAVSAGPNCIFDLTPEQIKAAWDAERGAWREERLAPFEYDTSNGTVSAGDILVLSPPRAGE